MAGSHHRAPGQQKSGEGAQGRSDSWGLAMQARNRHGAVVLVGDVDLHNTWGTPLPCWAYGREIEPGSGMRVADVLTGPGPWLKTVAVSAPCVAEASRQRPGQEDA